MYLTEAGLGNEIRDAANFKHHSAVSYSCAPVVNRPTRSSQPLLSSTLSHPLPLPIRVSAGFFVTGMSVKTLIHS